MVSLTHVPGNDAKPVDLADWVEISSLFFAEDRNTSREDLARALHRLGLAEEKARSLAEEAFSELSDRLAATSIRVPARRITYPFALIKGDQVLQARPLDLSKPGPALVYPFLLSVTIWSMASTKRKLAGVDPTHTFEKMCADVLASFWGGRSQSSGTYIVGTSSGRTKAKFPKAIADLCDAIGEGGGWRPGATSARAGDGGLDVAAWRRFADGRPGGLVGFAQCKTGIHWRDELGKLRPKGFSNKYMRTPLLVDPVIAYMVPCRVQKEDWTDRVNDCGGLLFDRCRLTQFADAIDDAVLDECAKWLAAAVKQSREVL